MARRRFQEGSLYLQEGKRRKVWVGRWREDVIEGGQVKRISRRVVLGTHSQFPTRRLAQRELVRRLAEINSPSYQARPLVTFEEFARVWEAHTLPSFKRSTQSDTRSQLNKHLIPFFATMQLQSITPQVVQRFIATRQGLSPKRVKNLVATLRIMWRQVKQAGITHNPFDSIALPRQEKPRAASFTREDVEKILAAAEEPYRTFYWLAVETGMRSGELCALRIEDLNLEAATIRVSRAVWRGQLQSPKSLAALRELAISPVLSAHLESYLRSWRSNSGHLLFATRKGTPWLADLVVKRKLHPLLKRLGIAQCGLHGFRHANATLMDALNAPVKIRQQRLGHTDSRVTLDTYTHVGADERQLAKQLGEVLWRSVAENEKGLQFRKPEALVAD